jgi:hypothetical protein
MSFSSPRIAAIDADFDHTLMDWVSTAVIA